jgi:hypothetical protein
MKRIANAQQWKSMYALMTQRGRYGTFVSSARSWRYRTSSSSWNSSCKSQLLGDVISRDTFADLDVSLSSFGQPSSLQVCRVLSSHVVFETLNFWINLHCATENNCHSLPNTRVSTTIHFAEWSQIGNSAWSCMTPLFGANATVMHFEMVTEQPLPNWSWS